MHLRLIKTCLKLLNAINSTSLIDSIAELDLVCIKVKFNCEILK